MNLDFEFHSERIDPTVVICQNATVRGRVSIRENSSVWYQAVVRGDTEEISIGARTNVQDLALLHADAGVPCHLGNDITIGHAAIVHGAKIEDEVLIGIRATVLNNARIGTGSLIAAGCLIPEGTDVPPNSVMMGIPGKRIRECTAEDYRRIRNAAEHYVAVAKEYRGYLARLQTADRGNS